MHRCGVFCFTGSDRREGPARFPDGARWAKIAADSHGRRVPGRGRSRGETMTFLNAYFTAIDLIAIVAVLVLVIVAFLRSENVWLGLMLLVVVIWAGSAVLGYY